MTSHALIGRRVNLLVMSYLTLNLIHLLADKRRGAIHRNPFVSISFLIVLLTALPQLGCMESTGAKTSASSTDPTEPGPSIIAQPASQKVAVGQTVTFLVTCAGTMPLSYQWQKNGIAVGGATSATLTTSAAAISDSGSRFTVIVSNPDGSVTSNVATLTVNATPVAITVNPNSAPVMVGNIQQFIGNVTGTSNTAVTWTVSGAGCTRAACGTISSNGLYAAPESVPSPATVTVEATSVADPTKSASASLAIVAAVAVLLSISPTSADVSNTDTQLFTASITGPSNTAVSWSLSGTGCKGSACGTLSANSLSAVYSAPVVAPSPATVSVTATSVADPTKSASAGVIIVPTTVVIVTPTDVSVTAGSTQQFTASVTGASNTAVAWTLSGTSCSGTACGTINSSGLYAAPAAVPSPGTVAVTASSAADSTKSASADVRIQPIAGTTYYLATAADGGSDSNNGLSTGSPWLSPKHAVNCGDVILAAASTAYVAQNFQGTNWGTVTCAAGNNVAWLKCVTFDACKIIVTDGSTWGMVVTRSYWGVQGWEITITEDSGAGPGCFTAAPYYQIYAEVHHIIFANNVVNGCSGGGGFVSDNGGSTSYGVDYFAIVGNISYNAANGSTGCYSGIDTYQPRQSDSLPGTHIYIAGNFSWGNFDPNPCSGGAPSDGEGIIIDTPDGTYTFATPYAAQIVIDNNILVANGGRGFEVYQNSAGSAHAAIYARHNTIWGNNRDPNQDVASGCDESVVSKAFDVQQFFNISATNATTGCGGYPVYAYYVASGDSTDLGYSNVGWSASGTYSGMASSSGFSYGPNNLFGTNPSFVNATTPGAPNCGTAKSVPNCMATVIANFTPTTAAAIPYGYQVPSAKQTYDPLFPQWLCSVTNFPAGLVTMGCLTASASALSASVTLQSGPSLH
jgi:hypothetical protein